MEYQSFTKTTRVHHLGTVNTANICAKPFMEIWAKHIIKVTVWNNVAAEFQTVYLNGRRHQINPGSGIRITGSVNASLDSCKLLLLVLLGS